MKKITLVAALLGVTYTINAQVGIGTSQPALASQLEISATDKGILIPRVRLTDITTFAPIGGTAVESLLVYNIGTTTGTTGVTPGFYYWVPVNGTVSAHWERIVNQTQLDEAIGDITDLQGDVTKIIALLNTAFPSNNLVTGATHDDTVGGGMVFTPGTTPTIEYVYFDGANYVKKDITTDIINLIKGAESKTTFIEFPAASGKYYYISEETINANNGVIPTSPFSTGTTLRPGVILLDVPQSVITNFQTILDGTTTVVKPGGSFYTVEEIIKMIASQVEGNVIYTNIGTTGAPNWVFQYWSDAANAGAGGYVTINLTDLVGAAQSKTALVKTNTANTPVKQYFISEAYLIANAGAIPSQTVINGWPPGTLPAGVFEIDIVAGVSTNFETILSQSTTIVKTTSPTTYYTVQEYIEFLSENNLANGVTRIVLNGGQASFEQWNNTTNTWVPVTNAAFSTIVKANETVTTINKVQTGTAPAGDVEITYNYFNETSGGTTPQQSIDLDGDVLNLIEGNTDIQNAITNILNDGGNVYYGDHDSNATTPNVFYTIVNNIKTPIDISEVVVNAITNATTVQKQEIKNQLGDTYNTTTITNTGDTWIDGGKIYASVYNATVAANTANVSAINIALPAGTTALGNIVSIKLIDNATNNLINTSTTDVALTGNVLNFKIGTGNMYNVLSTSNLSVKVLVEFSAQ